MRTVYLPGGGEHDVAIGCLPIIDSVKVLNAAAPNFVHSLDAAHLCRIANFVPANDATRSNHEVRDYPESGNVCMLMGIRGEPWFTRVSAITV